MTPPRPVALILAAGRGRRFGSDKRRAPMSDGRSLLQATCDVYVTAFDRVFVTLRTEDAALAGALRTRHRALEPILSPRAEDGMGGSLADGARDVPQDRGLVVGLGDMPWVSLATLVAVRDALGDTADRIVQPRHAGRAGHPVAFGRNWLPALAGLDGDVGARSVLRDARDLRHLDLDDPGILADVDTPDALTPGN